MAGIYIHIPFCKTRCLYCDFCSSTDSSQQSAYVDALCSELHKRRDYLAGQNVETIYFGGGTPSQLTSEDFRKIFNALCDCKLIPSVSTMSDKEISLEANPDDLTPAYLRLLRQWPFNRISMGVQSFNDEELRFLNRRHTASAAVEAVVRCQALGFDNISIDLMYGLPGQSLTSWETSIRQAIALNVQHISAYHLIYEDNTPLNRLLQAGKIQPVDEDLSLAMFELLIDLLHEAGMEQYEISNFARPGYMSRHNSSYWNGSPYLGIGAAAHSYNGVSRQWNQSIPNASYLNAPHETETLSEKDIFNDFILTRLRTMKGIDLNELASAVGAEYSQSLPNRANRYVQSGHLIIENNHLHLTRKGIFVSDGIMADLML